MIAFGPKQSDEKSFSNQNLCSIRRNTQVDLCRLNRLANDVIQKAVASTRKRNERTTTTTTVCFCCCRRAKKKEKKRQK